MNPDFLALGFLEYVVFLFSTTCHEAAHALVAKWGGDTTALEAGQVSLNPLPHIRREPFGMVVMPLLGLATGTLIGWASTPYNPKWAQEHPKRAAWMSLAGPVANFTMAIISGVIMRIGLAMGSFIPAEFSFTQVVAVPAGAGGVAVGVATVLSVMFSLNILLGTFNLIPFPPLDGYGILGLFTTEQGALRLQEWRVKMGAMAIIGLVVAWQVFDRVYSPLFSTSIHILYAGYRFS